MCKICWHIRKCETNTNTALWSQQASFGATSGGWSQDRGHTHTHTFTPLPSTSLLPCQSRLITARIWPSRWANLPCYAAPLKSSVPPSPHQQLQDAGGEREGNREGCRGRNTPPPQHHLSERWRRQCSVMFVPWLRRAGRVISYIISIFFSARH